MRSIRLLILIIFIGNTSEEVVEAQHRYLEAQDRGDHAGIEGAGYDPFRPNPSYDLPPSESESDTESSGKSDSEQDIRTERLQENSTLTTPTAKDKCDDIDGNLTKPERACDKSEQSGDSNNLGTNFSDKCTLDVLSKSGAKDG